MRKLRIDMSIVLVLCAFSSLTAQKLEYVNSTLWGRMNSAVIRGDYAYVAFANGLGIFDIAEKAQPRLISQLYIPGREEGIEIKGQYAFMAAGYAGLRVIDIADIREPKLVASCSLGVFTRGLCIEGDYAFVVGNDLHIVNIANPESVFVFGSVFTQGQNSFSVLVKGNYAYMADEDAGLQVIDVEDKSKPTVVANLVTYGWTYGLAEKGDCLYVAEGYVGGFVGLQSVDISNPLKPTSSDSCWTRGWAMTVALAGNCAFVPESPAGGFPSLAVIDISDPANLTLSRAPDTIWGTNHAIVDRDYLYLTGSEYENGGFYLFDIRDKAHPVHVGEYDTYRISGLFADSVFCYAALGYYGGLRIINFVGPEDKRAVGGFNISKGIEGIFKVHNCVYAAGFTGLSVIDITNPSQPLLTGRSEFENSIDRLSVWGNYAYLANPDRIEIIDIEDSTNPKLIGQYDNRSDTIGGMFFDVCVEGKYAYVANHDYGLQVIDISNPESTVLVGGFWFGSIRESGGAIAVKVSGNYAFMAIEYLGLAIIDILNPEHPSLAGAYRNTYRATDVFVTRNYAYFTDAYGLHLIDISDADNPRAVTHFDAGAGGNRVFVVNDNVYLATESALIALRLTP